MPEIVFASVAMDDLDGIYDWIAEAAEPDVAHAYVTRIRRVCMSLGQFPDRGRQREDLSPGVRSLAFERRAVIAYRSEGDKLVVLRVVHRGRDLQAGFEE